MRYVAYAVDVSGVARAVHEIDCPTDKDAETRAEKFLEAHPTVELWDGPAELPGWCVRARQIDIILEPTKAAHGGLLM